MCIAVFNEMIGWVWLGLGAPGKYSPPRSSRGPAHPPLAAVSPSLLLVWGRRDSVHPLPLLSSQEAGAGPSAAPAASAPISLSTYRGRRSGVWE